MLFTICLRNFGEWPDTIYNGIIHAETGMLCRTGPYVPPLSFPGIRLAVVTSALKAELQAHKITGIDYSRVRIQKAVRSPWNGEMEQPPPDDEALTNGADFILNGNHDEQLAEHLENALWYLELDVRLLGAQIGPTPGGWFQLSADLSEWDGVDVFWTKIPDFHFGFHLTVSDKVKQILERYEIGYLEFAELVDAKNV